MRRIKKLLRNPRRILQIVIQSRIGRIMPDVLYLKALYYFTTGQKLDLGNPRSFNEKIQWLKIHDRREEYTSLVDKYSVKEYVTRELGEEYVIPTLGIWENFDEIEVEKLPKQFVLKCTHDSGGVIVCQDKDNFDFAEAKRKIDKLLKKNYFYSGREWPYLNISPQIIAEKYMTDSQGDGNINDYKVFVFNGVPYCIQVDFDRFTNHRRNFYSVNWEYLPFTTCYPTDESHYVEKPKDLERLLELSEKLAGKIGNPPFVRTDFYIIEDKIYFGEITFYHGSGFEKFMPEEWNKILGDAVDLGKGNTQ